MKIAIRRVAWCSVLLLLASACALVAQDVPMKVIQVGSRPVAVAINPVVNQAFVVNKASRDVMVIDLAAGRVIGSYIVGGVPESVAVNTKTNKLVVTNLDSYVTVIDHGQGKIESTIPVGKSPSRVVIDTQADQALVTNFNSANMVVIDLNARKVVKTIALKNGPLGIELLGNPRRAVVACQYDMMMVSVDLEKDAVDKELVVGRYLSEVAANPVTGQVLVGNPSNNGIVAVYDLAQNAVLTTVPVGAGPLSLAVYPKRNVALVAEYNAGTVSVLDIGTSRVIRSIKVADGPAAVAVHPESGIAVVVSKLAGSVAVFDVNAVLGPTLP
jgi:YVTN family beta-propeller protein